ncbi:MAG: hypothetical protein GXY33_02325 [Phycisphaerae bacterium]|nr:hypothetical protein [Phycisphaerae bacterium]
MKEGKGALSGLDELVGQVVVIDFAGPTMIIGRLVRIADDAFVLDDADLYDREESHSGKELYLINTRKFGVKVSRRRTYVPRQNAIAVSALDDVIAD